MFTSSTPTNVIEHSSFSANCKWMEEQNNEFDPTSLYTRHGCGCDGRNKVDSWSYYKLQNTCRYCKYLYLKYGGFTHNCCSPYSVPCKCIHYQYMTILNMSLTSWNNLGYLWLHLHILEYLGWWIRGTQLSTIGPCHTQVLKFRRHSMCVYYMVLFLCFGCIEIPRVSIVIHIRTITCWSNVTMCIFAQSLKVMKIDRCLYLCNKPRASFQTLTFFYKDW